MLCQASKLIGARSGRNVPPALVRHVAQFKALQETVVSLNVQFEEVPRIPIAQRAEVHHVADGFWQITLRFGFVEIPNVRSALACAQQQGCPVELDEAVYVAARDAVVRSRTKPRLSAWRRALFSVM
jgi:KUP system potassium uptake protein